MELRLAILPAIAISLVQVGCQQSEIEKFDAERAKALASLREELKKQPGTHGADEAYIRLFMIETDRQRSDLIKREAMNTK